MPRAHVEARKGTIQQAIEYCQKEGDWEEHGEKPKMPKEKGEGEKKRWRRIFEKAEEGDEDWLKENEPNVAFKHMATFRSHKKAKKEPLNYVDTPHEWWVGPTGTGKSKKVWEEYPTHYAKEKNKWWCNYTGQDTVVIEEADPKNMEHLADRLKVWADRYPFPGEIKGGRIEGIRPLKVIVTSNYTPEECFPNSNDLEPILRRFKVVNLEPILLLILNTQSLNSNETCREAQRKPAGPRPGSGDRYLRYPPPTDSERSSERSMTFP